MPHKNKALQMKNNLFFIIIIWIALTERLNSSSSPFSESRSQRSSSLLQPKRGHCPGRSDDRTSRHHRFTSAVKWFCSVLVKGCRRGGAAGRESLVDLQLFCWFPRLLQPLPPLLFPLRLSSCHRKLSSTRSLQSRHISSSRVMSSKVSPSCLA